MLSVISRKWWVLLLNGIFAILFGIMAFAWPGPTLLTLVMIYGVFCVADGFTAIGASSGTRDATGRSWWQMVLIGILSIAAGIISFAWPKITAVALLMVIAFWAIARGVFEIIAAIELRRLVQNEWMLILAGAASILFGVLLISRPGVGALAMMWLFGTFAILHGLLLVALSFKLRAFKQIGLQT